MVARGDASGGWHEGDGGGAWVAVGVRAAPWHGRIQGHRSRSDPRGSEVGYRSLVQAEVGGGGGLAGAGSGTDREKAGMVSVWAGLPDREKATSFISAWACIRRSLASSSGVSGYRRRRGGGGWRMESRAATGCVDVVGSGRRPGADLALFSSIRPLRLCQHPPAGRRRPGQELRWIFLRVTWAAGSVDRTWKFATRGSVCWALIGVMDIRGAEGDGLHGIGEERGSGTGALMDLDG